MTLLHEEEANIINAIDLSSVTDAFTDHQHHSGYGAFLIYQKIIECLDERKSN